MLALLWSESMAGRALSSEILNQQITEYGQTKPLNRAQTQRLLDSLNAFFSRLQQCHLSLQTAPRKATVGPWKLISHGVAFITEADETNSNEALEETWGFPKLLLNTGEGGESGTDLSGFNLLSELHEMLLALLNSDAFSVNGEYKDAIETQSCIYRLHLSPEFADVLKMREALWHKRIGDFDQARSIAREVLNNPKALDMGLIAQAQFFLFRIDYDESPGQNHAKLWLSAEAPPPSQQPDIRTLPEWHNLRALLARRRLMAIVESTQIRNDALAATAIVNDQTAIETTALLATKHLHTQALNHMQSAIYWAVQFRDWDRLQAYVANLSFYLQCVQPYGLATVPEVFMWHRLCLNYGDKLYLSQDSGWEYIFFGEFWLDHHVEISDYSAKDPLAHTVNDAHPSQQSFYINAIAKLTVCADARQIAIMWLLYERFVLEHLIHSNPYIKSVLTDIRSSLNDLLQKNNGLETRLRNEGYYCKHP